MSAKKEEYLEIIKQDILCTVFFVWKYLREILMSVLLGFLCAFFACWGWSIIRKELVKLKDDNYSYNYNCCEFVLFLFWVIPCVLLYGSWFISCLVVVFIDPYIKIFWIMLITNTLSYLWYVKKRIEEKKNKK